MPKIAPKLTNRKDGRAVVHYKGKMYVMGKIGTPEAQKAFHRFCLELHTLPTVPIIPENESCSITELVAGFLDFSLATHLFAKESNMKKRRALAPRSCACYSKM